MFIKSSACTITTSNTTCCCNHTILLLEWFIFSRTIEFTYLMNCFKYLLVSSLLLTGLLRTLSTVHWSSEFLFHSLAYCTGISDGLLCVPCLHGHSGLPIIFNRCKYDRIFPWSVIIVVTLGLKVKFTASLLSTLGKNSLVIAPFVVSSYWRCHFLMLSFRVSFFMALLEYLLLCYNCLQYSAQQYAVQVCSLGTIGYSI
jgi:hypothetical protein